MVIKFDGSVSCICTDSGKDSKKRSTIHSSDVLGGALQVTSGAVLTYDLHFKINFVLKLGVRVLFLLLQAIGAIVCVLIHQLHQAFPLPSSVWKEG